MKKTLLTVAIAALSAFSYAQVDSKFGVKAGLNYNANGDYFESAGEAARNPDRNVGYHIGFFGQVGSRVYIRPELVYTSISSEYDNDDFKMQKLDLPLLIGTKIIGPLHVFGGPAFQYILDTEYDGITISDVRNDFTIGLNLGAGINLGKLGIDLRYERGFSDNEASFINTNVTTVPQSRIDTRPDQLILSFSLTL
ncbi:outer membrane beta-barrel protein [Muriicola sp. E247]|uniref:outer membrane beta-barrel protein n=1 Tax=Muriicola sp. E247 TaxID=3242730 RepID=UPI003524035F